MGEDYALWPILSLLIGVPAWITGTRFRRGSILSPYSLTLLILLSIFGVRPLLMPGELESFKFYGYSIDYGFEQAAMLGFIGITSFVVGYAALKAGVLAKPVSHGTSVSQPAKYGVHAHAPSRSAFVALGLVAAWFGAMIVLGGGIGFLEVLFAGRSEETLGALAGVPAIVSALPVVGCLLVAATRFQYERARRYSRPQSLAYWLVTIVAVVPPTALGSRRYLIPSVVIVLLGSLNQHWQKKVKLKWVIGGVAAFLALAAVPFIRSAGSRTRGSTDFLGAMGEYFGEEGVRGVLNNFFLSWDTEMFNYVAYLAPRMGENIQFGMGRGTVGEVLALPLPAAISPFQRWNDVLLEYAFGDGCSVETACPVPSIIGVLYSDLAIPGLILGMLILGGMASRFEHSLARSNSTYTGVLLLTAGFAVLFARGNSMAQAWIAFQCFVMWWAINKLIITRKRRQNSEHEDSYAMRRFLRQQELTAT